jgi:hypothetical protein
MRTGNWIITNGIGGQMPICDVCAQPIREGHVDCSCDKSHNPENCDRPTYSELEAKLANSRRISGENMDFAVRYRNVLQALLDRRNHILRSGNDTSLLTHLSPRDIEEIETALEAR